MLKVLKYQVLTLVAISTPENPQLSWLQRDDQIHCSARGRAIQAPPVVDRFRLIIKPGKSTIRNPGNRNQKPRNSRSPRWVKKN